MTHLSVRVIINQGGLIRESPLAGALSVGIGHPLCGGDLQCEISLLTHTSGDPAGAKPRRDHRSLARMSRGAAPKTPGKKSLGMMYDPARVSHLFVDLCDTLAGSLSFVPADPRVFGATPLDLVTKKRAPARGCHFAPARSAGWTCLLGVLCAVRHVRPVR